jgi:quinol monooxygenase YgiN
MTEETLKEPGCLQYVVHQSRDNPRCFAFYEQYKDEAALDFHWSTPHFSKYLLGGVDRLVDSRTREIFVPIG